jgi:hypothetical protein
MSLATTIKLATSTSGVLSIFPQQFSVSAHYILSRTLRGSQNQSGCCGN